MDTGHAQVGHYGDKVRGARLRWFGHVQRRDSEYIGIRMLKMEGTRQEAKSKYMDVLMEDIQIVGGQGEIHKQDFLL